VLPAATAFACQRACKQMDHLATQIYRHQEPAAGDRSLCVARTGRAGLRRSICAGGALLP
jgi:hypothetical protein